MIIVFLLLNYGISVFNAWMTGKVWIERRQAPWLVRINIYAGAIMSACGFIWCYLVLECGGLMFIHQHPLPDWNIWTEKANQVIAYMPADFPEQVFALGYLIIILPILGSGLAITAEAWAIAWRRRSFGNIAVASWDTFAQIYNTVQFIRVLPDALSSVGDLFGFGDDDDEDNPNWIMLAIGLVLLALIGGIATTVLIIRRSAGTHTQHLRDKYGQRLDLAAAQAAARRNPNPDPEARWRAR